MSELVVANFGGGLDARKFFLSLPPGTLTKCVNAHITSGAEIEKRLAFVQQPFANGTGYAFGALPAGSNILTFGSAGIPIVSITISGTNLTMTSSQVWPPGLSQISVAGSSVAGTNGTFTVSSQSSTHVSLNGQYAGSQSGTFTVSAVAITAGLPGPVLYQYLPDPTGTGLNMTGVVSADLFGGKAFVAAKFSDGNTYCFYNGVLVEDFLAGLVTSWSDTDDEIASALVALVNATASANGTTSLVYAGQILSSGNQLTITSTPTISSDAPFTTAVVTDLQAGSTGTLTALFQSSGVPESAAVGATATMSVIAGTVGPRANAQLNGSSTTNVTATNTITIGSVTYTFVSSLTNAPAYSVLIAGSGNTDTSFANLVLAINGTGTPGTNYSTGTLVHPQVTAGNVTAHNVTITAIQSGTGPNAYAVSTTPSSIAGVTHPWTYSGSPTTTLQGGSNTNQITQISAGLTNLLSNPVQFDTNINQTAQDIAAAINNNTESGFTAVAAASQNSVVITAPATTGAGYNGTPLIITSAGNVCCVFCSFTIVSMSGVQTIGPIEVNGSVDLLQSSTVAFDTSTSQTATDVATAINSHTGTTNYLACAIGAAVYIAPTVVNTSAAAPTIVVTYSATTLANTASAGLVASITPTVVDTNQVFGSPGSFQSSPPFSCVVSGGTPPYTYRWSVSPALPTSGALTASLSSTTTPSVDIGIQWTAGVQSYTNSFTLTCNVTDSATPTPNTAASICTWSVNFTK